ncbi:unnamed protein product [Pleuronectes platessa]|uniref:C2 domain-containing protein n=1 Tax=Pleuronectes platessa TaxID=8262 RepID=A0A9N7UY98_PLEPL|nr:unnamed protein product [Pleuronectes platessa]
MVSSVWMKVLSSSDAVIHQEELCAMAAQASDVMNTVKFDERMQLEIIELQREDSLRRHLLHLQEFGSEFGRGQVSFEEVQFALIFVSVWSIKAELYRCGEPADLSVKLLLKTGTHDLTKPRACNQLAWKESIEVNAVTEFGLQVDVHIGVHVKALRTQARDFGSNALEPVTFHGNVTKHQPPHFLTGSGPR